MVFRRLGRHVRNLLGREQNLDLVLAEHRQARTAVEFDDEGLYAYLNPVTASLEEARSRARSGQFRQASQALWEHFHDRIRPRPFLHTSLVDPLVDVMRGHAGYARRIVNAAERVLSHEFAPLGCDPYTFSGAIDWFSDFQGRSWIYGHVDSLSEQFALSSAVTEGMGDIELTWDFNCHAHFQDLSRAYWLTGNEPFASEFIVEVVDWSERNPALFGVNWLNPHTVAVRCFHWLSSWQLFLASAQLQGDACARVLRTLILHGAVLADLIENMGVRRVACAASLYLLAAHLPEVVCAARWREIARRALAESAAHELGREGFHRSGSMSLHREALEWLLLVATHDYLNSKPIADLRTALEGGVEALVYLRSPNGAVPELGPVLGTTLLGRHAGASEHTHRLLSLAALVTGREDWAHLAGDFPCELHWWLGPEGEALSRGLGRSEPQGIRRIFHDVGLAVCRDHWGPRSSWCMLRTMPPAASRQNEIADLLPPPPARVPWHDDYLSLLLTLEGEPVLMEPGGPGLSGPIGDLFGRISSHSAIRVGREMEPLSGAPLDDDDIGVLESNRDGFYLSSSRPVWFMPDRPWKLTREVLFLPKKQRLIVRDQLDGEGEVHVESNLLLAPHLDVLMRGDMGCLLRGKKLQARIIPIFPSRFRYELCRGRAQPFSGFYWSESGKAVPTNLLRYYARLDAPATIILWMVWNPDDTTVPRAGDVERMFRQRG